MFSKAELEAFIYCSSSSYPVNPMTVKGNWLCCFFFFPHSLMVVSKVGTYSGLVGARDLSLGKMMFWMQE